MDTSGWKGLTSLLICDHFILITNARNISIESLDNDVYQAT
jgi:hypothetical protein